MSINDLDAQLKRLGPWLFRFTINEVQTNGCYPLADDPKAGYFAQEYSNVRTVLELGSCEGYVSFNLARRVERVVAIEGRAENFEKARFLQRFLDPDNRVQFIQGNVERYNLASLGAFDVVWCSGLLYHLPQPWLLIKQMPLVSNNLFLSTHYCLDTEVTEIQQGFAGRWFQEGGQADPLSGLSPRSFWLTIGSLVYLLSSAGYTTIKILRNSSDNPAGAVVILTASTS